jgi:ankyrin repeat protein
MKYFNLALIALTIALFCGVSEAVSDSVELEEAQPSFANLPVDAMEQILQSMTDRAVCSFGQTSRIHRELIRTECTRRAQSRTYLKAHWLIARHTSERPASLMELKPLVGLLASMEHVGKILALCTSVQWMEAVKYLQETFPDIDPIAAELADRKRFEDVSELLVPRLDPTDPLFLSPMSPEERFIVDCGRPPMIFHFIEDDSDILQYLLDNGANVDIRSIADDNRWTALMFAVMHKNTDAISLLIQHGALVDEKDIYGLTAFMYASMLGNVDVVSSLLAAGAFINEKENRGRTALMIATEQNIVNVASFLIARGALVNEKSESGYTALMYATPRREIDLALLLIQSGALVNEKEYKGWTALMMASQLNNVAVVSLLLDHDALVHEKNNDGRTALIIASKSRSIDVMSLLIAGGALVNEKDNDGWTPLMIAAKEGHVKIVSLLIECNALVNLRNNNGQTALTIATGFRHLSVADLLRRAGGSS